jgi:hypothetical protein
MRIVSLLTLALVFLFTTSCEESELFKKKVNVPEAVKTAFNQDYPNAEDVEWEEEGENYEVEFEDGDTEMEILYDANGTLIQIETEIEVNQLPETILTYIQNNYSNPEIEDAYSIWVAAEELTYYEVEIELEDEERELLFDASGNLLQEEVEGDEDDCDDDD